jgi:hypothetical protein
MNAIILNSKPRDGLLSAAKREPAVPCPGVAPWVSAAKAGDGKTGSETADFAA